MDRETIIKFCNSDRKVFKEVIEIIAAYCEEMGKKSEDIQLFIRALQIIPIYNSEFLNIALNYFKRKYIIFDLYRPNDMVENQGWYFVKSY